MVPLLSLWLPIIVATVAVFITSNAVWMVLQLHKKDWTELPDEEALAETLNGMKAGRGEYSFPFAADAQAWKDEGWKAKFQRGPVGFLVLQTPGEMNMGKMMGSWVAYLLVIQTFIAYLASHTLPSTATFAEVFRVTGTAGMLAFAGAAAPEAIWMGRLWRNALGHMRDGIVYGLVSAAVFGWLWPA